MYKSIKHILAFSLEIVNKINIYRVTLPLILSYLTKLTQFSLYIGK